MVLCSTYETFPLPTALKIAQERNIPLIADLRDITEQFGANYFTNRHPKAPWLGKWFAQLKIKNRNKVVKQASAVTSVSPWHVQYLSQLNPNVHLVYNGYDAKEFYFKPISSSKFNLVYTGRLVDEKAQDPTLKTANRVLNRSTQSVRSPGSSMKPLASYGPTIAENLVHYSSMLRDAPITLVNGKKWPHNYEVKSTPDNGDVLLGIALQKSLNTTAARLVQTLTPQRSYDYAVNTFRLSTLVEAKAVNGSIHTDVDLSPLALGALTDGATAREMAAAYAIFGNGGYYSEPYTYYQVTKGKDEDETVLLTGGQKSDPALDPQTAYVMVSLLQRVVKQGTAWNGVGQNWKDWPVFGKTGTSESEKDVYFVGGTAYYCASSWFGYDNNQELAKTQTGYAKSLWSKAMKVLHKNLQIKDFDMPGGIEVLEYCTKTGQLATEACTELYYVN